MKSYIKKIIDSFRLLNTSIYTGQRLKANLTALTAVSIFTAVLGLALVFMDLITGQRQMLLPAFATLAGGMGCAYLAGIRKYREVAIIIPTAFCLFMFTYYALQGVGEGTGILWSLLLPIGLSYFVSVKYGIFLSVYYTLLFCLLFYSPLRMTMAQYYSDAFLTRFPIIYGSLSIFNAIAMLQYHKSALTENVYTGRLNEEVEKQTRMAKIRADKLDKLSEEMVQTLAVAIDAKDRYTNGHSFRVSWYSIALAGHMRWSEDDLEELNREALLHDIGKIGVPDSVLNKPGKLNDNEYNVIKSHTTVGGNILSRAESLKGAADVARYHHERYDGKGYPEGLAGEDIPRHARVVAIADAYDAMRSDRIYRKGLPAEAIRNELVKGKGKQFDPEFLDFFLELFDEGILDQIARRRSVISDAEREIEESAYNDAS